MLIIGEKINATRKSVAEAIKQRNEGFIAELAEKQATAGADVIDVNAGSLKGRVETAIEDMRWLVKVVKAAVDKPLAIDSDNVDVLEAGLQNVTGPAPWINSVTAEASRLDRVLPLAKKYGGPVVALCMGEQGIPKDVEGRVAAAKIIMEAGAKIGIEPDRIYFDPLVMPVSTDGKAGTIIMDTIKEIKKRFPGSKTMVGLSNISFGLPMREVLNNNFLVLCMGAGLDAAILDPTNNHTMFALRAADALLGHDDYCTRYIKHFRSAK